MAPSEPNPNTSALESTPKDCSKNAVEMKSLESQSSSPEASKDVAASSIATPSHPGMSQPSPPNAGETAAQQSTSNSSSAAAPLTHAALSSTVPLAAVATSSDPAALTPSALEHSRLDSVAIGPATDVIKALALNPDAGLVCQISLLISHTGARHAYKIDEKYLTKRNVDIPEVTENGKKDPFSISIYTLKQLILREWKDEWEAKPSSPSSIRLIHFGKMMDDKNTLREVQFKEGSPNVVHIAVRPQDVVDDEEASKSKALGRERGDGERTAGCRCVIL